MTTYEKSRRGFTLLEMVIVLGVTGLIFAGLWGLLSGGSGQLQAQSAAQQYRQVMDAVRQYAVANYSAKAAGPVAPVLTIATLSAPGVGLLKPNFPANDVFGNPINIVVEVINGAQNQYRYMVYSANGGISDKTGAQVASLIGSDGGFVYSVATPGCQTVPPAPIAQLACGAYGSFAFNVGNYGIGAAAGRIATLSYTNDSNSANDPYLYRNRGFGTPASLDRYTMHSNMFFGASPAGPEALGSSLYMQGNFINMGLVGAVTAGGALNMAKGTLSMQGGTLDMGTGPMTNAISIGGADLTVAMTLGNIRLNSPVGTVVGSATVAGATGRIVSLQVHGTTLSDIMEGGQFIYSSSDVSYKENIQPIANALQKILELHGHTYEWKTDHTKDVGLIAQEVQKVFPEVVGKTSNGKLGIDYARIVAPLVEAVRELKNDNDQLRKEIEGIKKEQAVIKK